MMKISDITHRLLLLIALGLLTPGHGLVFAQRREGAKIIRPQTAGRVAAKVARIQERNVRAHMEFLASDAMQGRGSVTQFELLAGHYIASQLRQFGVEPSGDMDAVGQQTFLQTVALTRQSLAAAPVLSFSANGQIKRWEHGREMLVGRISTATFTGALQKLRVGEMPQPGAVVLLSGSEGSNAQPSFAQAMEMARQGAAAVLVLETPAVRQRWAAMGAELPQLPVATNAAAGAGSIFVLSADAYGELQQVADGTPINLEGTLAPAQTNYTWNVVGVLRGSAPKLASEAVLLSAHMDHLGVGGEQQAGDQIYNVSST